MRDENLRPIERYWAEFKKEFKSRKSLSKNLMQGLKRKLQAVANGGVLEPYKLNDK
jgi:hypothetical protein